MSYSAEHLDWLVDQLQDLGPVSWRPAWGRAGLFLDGAMFGIVDGEAVHFRADDATRARYVDRGCRPFEPGPGRASTTWYEVPAEVLEDPAELVEWARAALASRR